MHVSSHETLSLLTTPLPEVKSNLKKKSCFSVFLLIFKFEIHPLKLLEYKPSVKVETALVGAPPRYNLSDRFL